MPKPSRAFYPLVTLPEFAWAGQAAGQSGRTLLTNQTAYEVNAKKAHKWLGDLQVPGIFPVRFWEFISSLFIVLICHRHIEGVNLVGTISCP